jgi:hypothetical protein
MFQHVDVQTHFKFDAKTIGVMMVRADRDGSEGTGLHDANRLNSDGTVSTPTEGASTMILQETAR